MCPYSHVTSYDVFTKFLHLKKCPKSSTSKSREHEILSGSVKLKLAKNSLADIYFHICNLEPILPPSKYFHVLENSWVIYITDHLWSLFYLLSVSLLDHSKACSHGTIYHCQAVSKSWIFLYRFFKHWPPVHLHRCVKLWYETEHQVYFIHTCFLFA